MGEEGSESPVLWNWWSSCARQAENALSCLSLTSAIHMMTNVGETMGEGKPVHAADGGERPGGRGGVLWTAVLWTWHGHPMHALTVAVITCTRPSQRKSSTDRVEGHQATRFIGDLFLVSGRGRIIFFFDDMTTHRIPMFQWVSPHSALIWTALTGVNGICKEKRHEVVRERWSGITWEEWG